MGNGHHARTLVDQSNWVRLFVSGSEESVLAHDELSSAGFCVTTMPTDGFRAPEARVGGVWYRGLSEIRTLVRQRGGSD